MPVASSKNIVAPTHSPRNHWWTLEQALTSLEAKDIISAWKYLEAIRYSDLIPAETISNVMAMIKAAWGGIDFPLERPTDYYRQTPGGRTGLPVIRSLKANDDTIQRYPFEMALPPIVGNGNDFAFIQDVLSRQEFTGPPPDIKLRIITSVADRQQLEGLAAKLTELKTDLQRAGNIFLSIFVPRGMQGISLPLKATWHEGNPWSLARSEQLSYFCADTDAMVFTQAETIDDAFLLEQIQRYTALSKNLCLILTPKDQNAKFTTTIADRAIQKSWRGRDTAFTDLTSLSFAISAERFRKLGGFDPRFETEHFACREIGFRIYNSGSFFVPLLHNAVAPNNLFTPDAPADRDLLATLNPHGRDQKSSSRFEVPKVSIYIPAFRAARYLAESLDSILEQDFEDFEICVADDGSPDETAKILEHYARDPRVRFASSINGGIGHASNRAIHMARGMYIGQLDSDDRLTPGAISRLVQFLDNNPKVGCAYGSCERIGPSGNYIKNEYSWPTFSRKKMVLTSIAHHFRMFRRQAWERTDKFREDIANGIDYDIFLKMSEVTEFRHIDEILYQRRWHGENTSHVNEGFQTLNTHRVQREALKRLGLDSYWDVDAPFADRPREVTYKRIGSRSRVIFWPDYSQSNPYQRMLYKPVHPQCDIMGGDIDAAIRALREVKPCESTKITFHLHWLNKILLDSQNIGEASDKAQVFLSKLRRFKFLGGRIVWTIHNTLSHGFPFTGVEKNLSREIVELADAIHIHSIKSLPEIVAYFDIPTEKLAVHRHGAYTGIYPDFTNRERARKELGLDEDDEVCLFLGQIRPYKGIDHLVAAFKHLASERPRLKLVLAGSGTVESLFDDMDPELRDRVQIHNRFIDDMEIQFFAHAADFAVLPYKNILTSGSLLLSLSFGLPAIVPDYGMIREVLATDADYVSDCGICYPPEGGTDALVAAIRKMLDRHDTGEGPAMAKAAKERAAAETWEDISSMLFGDAA